MSFVVGSEKNHEDPNRASGNGSIHDNSSKNKALKVPFLKLFSFADKWDYLLMTLGSIGACAHGASVPVFFIFFGKLINLIGLAYLFPASVSHRVAKVQGLASECTCINL
jgi:ATP-binding cassette, subfamily B (MDR/TAP), member 1